MNQYKNLKVWQKGVELVVSVYKKTDYFPDKEKYGLITQINRCTVSIVSNIAEGAGRNSNKEFNNFLGITLGSSCELETQLIVANKLGYLSGEDLNELIVQIEEIQKMVVGLQKNIQQTNILKTNELKTND
ncbi:MAG TPA: four helix bundle protein [Bacteroidia bacterium]|jgi:four helix bundle protein